LEQLFTENGAPDGKDQGRRLWVNFDGPVTRSVTAASDLLESSLLQPVIDIPRRAQRDHHGDPKHVANGEAGHGIKREAEIRIE
jgi:hypothetical protein